MTLIIAARFPTFDAAHAAAQRLMQAGVPESALHVFFVNPPGAHDHYAVGGDQAADPGTRGAPNKALGMAALLGAIGAVAGGIIVSTFAESFIPIIAGAGVVESGDRGLAGLAAARPGRVHGRPAAARLAHWAAPGCHSRPSGLQ